MDRCPIVLGPDGGKAPTSNHESKDPKKGGKINTHSCPTRAGIMIGGGGRWERVHSAVRERRHRSEASLLTGL